MNTGLKVCSFIIFAIAMFLMFKWKMQKEVTIIMFLLWSNNIDIYRGGRKMKCKTCAHFNQHYDACSQCNNYDLYGETMFSCFDALNDSIKELKKVILECFLDDIKKIKNWIIRK